MHDEIFQFEIFKKVHENFKMERLHNLNCRENVQMARIADKVKRVANFLGLYLRKMGYSYRWSLPVISYGM